MAWFPLPLIRIGIGASGTRCYSSPNSGFTDACVESEENEDQPLPAKIGFHGTRNGVLRKPFFLKPISNLLYVNGTAKGIIASI
jgi:hypothetical protein